MNIKVGEYEVLESGTVIGISNENIDFILDNMTQFILRMTFIDDLSDNNTSLKAELFEKNGLKIIFTNFNNSLGNGNASPIKLGTIINRELYLNYRIYSQQDAGKLIHYTFLLGKEVKVGK